MKNFHKVSSNIYRGGAPNINDVKVLKDKFKINKIISLDQKSGDKIKKICIFLNIKQEIIPLDLSRKSLINFSKYNLKNLLESDSPIFIHCHHGKDRAGFVIALYKVKYKSTSPNDAIKEAESFGFGNGEFNSEDFRKTINLYKKIINSANQEDINNADIVSNERNFIGDKHDMFMEMTQPKSFAPFLDPTVPNYKAIDNQSPTRDNYDEPIIQHEYNKGLPLVGNFNNNSGMGGSGIAGDIGGFIYDT